MLDGHGIYFHGLMPSGNFLGQCSIDSIDCGQLILRKISTIGAKRWQILRLKCTQFDFNWGSAPDPTGAAYSDPRSPSSI